METVTASRDSVLIVDDEDSVLKLLTDAFSGNGFALRTASSVPLALELARSEVPGAVLTDLELGTMSGLDLLREMKILSPETPVIIMTGYASLESAVQAVNLGAYGYLQKPFDKMSLVVHRVEQALEHGRLLLERKGMLEKLETMNQELERDKGELARHNSELQQKVGEAVSHNERILRGLRDANTRLRELDRRKSEFIGVASHELRTPLASIKSFAEILLDSLDSLEKGTRQRFLSTINEEADRLTGLVEDLLDLQKIESGSTTAEIGAVRVESVRELLEMRFASQALEKGIELVFEFAPGFEPIEADERQLGQALSNLVSNALKYNPSGVRVRVGVARENGHVRFWVDDNGIGISEEDRDRIFERFYRGKGSAAAGVRGTGLGLAIVRAVAERHGGRVCVESASGRGSKFLLELPVNAKDRILHVALERTVEQAREAGTAVSFVLLHLERERSGEELEADARSHALDRFRRSVEKIVRSSDQVLSYQDDGVAVIEPTDAVGAKKSVERIARQVGPGTCEFGKEKGWLMTYGIASYPEDSKDLFELVKLAETRLREGAKGGDQIDCRDKKNTAAV